MPDTNPMVSVLAVQAVVGDEAGPLDRSIADLRAELDAIQAENEELQAGHSF